MVRVSGTKLINWRYRVPRHFLDYLQLWTNQVNFQHCCTSLHLELWSSRLSWTQPKNSKITEWRPRKTQSYFPRLRQSPGWLKTFMISQKSAAAETSINPAHKARVIHKWSTLYLAKNGCLVPVLIMSSSRSSMHRTGLPTLTTNTCSINFM